MEKAAKIVFATIPAYYKRLNPDSAPLRARRLPMITNSENNPATKENGNEQTQIKYIRCPECGEKIPMVPTLGEMIEEINHHVSTHRTQPKGDVAAVHLKAPTICMDLTKQVLQRAADIMEPDVTDARQKPSLWI